MTVYTKGVDYAFSHPSVASLVTGGYTFACRYLYPASQNPGTKNLTLAEATVLNAALADGVVSNYESVGGEALGGYAQGQACAHDAQAQHAACGGPPDRPIYFSVDFDTNPSMYDTIGGYFKGVASVIGLARTGAYGEYEIIKWLLDQGLIVWAWQTYAWSAGAFDERCQLAQDLNGQQLGGGNVDFDSAHAADFGQWNWTGDDMSAADVAAINKHTDAKIADVLFRLGNAEDFPWLIMHGDDAHPNNLTAILKAVKAIQPVDQASLERAVTDAVAQALAGGVPIETIEQGVTNALTGASWPVVLSGHAGNPPVTP